MKSKRNSRSVIVGIFIILGLAILVIGVFSLGKQKKSFVKGFTVNTIFNDVNGLQEGNNVWLSGVKVGTVKKINFLADTRVQVSMVLQKSLEPMIRKDALTRISSDGLIGNKIVVILGGTQSVPQVANNDFLVAQKAVSTEDMLSTLQANNKNLLAITGSFKSITNKIDSGTGVLGSLLNNKDLSNKIAVSVNELQSTMSNFEAASSKSKAVLANLNSLTDKLNAPGYFVHDLIADTSMYKDLRNSVSQLHAVTLNAGAITDNLKTLSDSLHSKNNAIGVLLNDEETAASIKQTIKNLESSSQKLDEDLEAAQHNFLLRHYFKKKNAN